MPPPAFLTEDEPQQSNEQAAESKTRGDLANTKQRHDESLLSYLERFKKTYEDIEGLSQDTVITSFEGGFRSKTLFTELQFRKPTSIGAMFNVARQIALAKKMNKNSLHKVKKRPRNSIPRRSPRRKILRESQTRARG